jgi:lysozyme
MNLARLERRLKQDEGYRPYPYRDSLGVWTIGYGRTVILGEKVSRYTETISEVQATEWLRADAYQAIMDAYDLFPNFEELSPVRREVLANMAFNLGKTKLSKFHRMRKAIDGRKYVEAANEMKNSRWYRQVGRRADRLIFAMLRDRYEESL